MVGSDLDEDFGNAAPRSSLAAVGFGSSYCEEHHHVAHRTRQFCRTTRYGRRVKDIVVASVACLVEAVDMERLPVEHCCHEVPFQPMTAPVAVVDWLEAQ